MDDRDQPQSPELGELIKEWENNPECLLERDRSGKTPAVHAAIRGDDECLDFIGSHFGNMALKRPDEDGVTPATWAATAGHADCLVAIATWARDALETVDDQGFTPAHVAAAKGHADCLEAIAEYAWDALNVRGQGGLTPAHIAASKGHGTCLAVLADFAPEMLSIASGWITPAVEATKNGHADCLEILAYVSPGLLDITVLSGLPLAGYAITEGQVKCLEAILRHAPDQSKFSTASSLNLATVAVLQGQADCLKVIANGNSDALRTVNSSGMNLAHVAAMKGNSDCLQTIAQFAPEELGKSDLDGFTPARFAAGEGYVDCLAVLSGHSPRLIEGRKRFFGGFDVLSTAYKRHRLATVRFIGQNAQDTRVRKQAERCAQKLSQMPIQDVFKRLGDSYLEAKAIRPEQRGNFNDDGVIAHSYRVYWMGVINDLKLVTTYAFTDASKPATQDRIRAFTSRDFEMVIGELLLYSGLQTTIFQNLELLPSSFSPSALGRRIAVYEKLIDNPAKLGRDEIQKAAEDELCSQMAKIFAIRQTDDMKRIWLDLVNFAEQDVAATISQKRLS